MASSVHNAAGYAGYNKKRQPHDPVMLPSEALAEMLRQRQEAREGSRVPFYDWALRVPEPKSGTLDFARFPFQKELYKEAAADQELVVKKATQVGVSAYLVRWAMYWADVKGLTALYVFPKLTQMYDFSDARIKAAILGSEYLMGRIPAQHVQNKGLKQIGLGFVYFRGSESKEALDSVDADVLCFDEYDTLVQENIEDAERRISGSELGLVRRVGVPSVPGFGISKLYEQSDQRRWHVRCGRCGDRQPLTFKDNVDQATLTRVCRSCADPLDVRDGEWVAEFPDRGTRGYHLPRLIVPQTNLKAIVEASRKRLPHQRQVHHNKDLAEEYAPEEGRLSLQAIVACQREFPMVPGYVGDNPVTMGVDVASVRALNVRVSEHLSEKQKRALWIGEVDGFDELALMMDRYGVHMACVDHLPDGRLARSFAERFAGRAYIVSYATTPGQVLQINEDMRHATVRRTEAIDATAELIRRQRNLLPIQLPHDYTDQMQAPIRFVEKDDLGKVKVQYRSTGPDDYMHAEVYDLVATELFWARQLVDEHSRDLLTPLDEMMEFRRSALEPSGEPSDGLEYRAGPDEGWAGGDALDY